MLQIVAITMEQPLIIMVTARALTSHQMPSQPTAWNRIGVLLPDTHWTPEQMSNDPQG
jgi:hypothetical protein